MDKFKKKKKKEDEEAEEEDDEERKEGIGRFFLQTKSWLVAA